MNLDEELETWDKGLFGHDDYEKNEKLILIIKDLNYELGFLL
jgi:hypothetical protein